MNVLFVCSRNQWRSPTAERVWARTSGLNVRSAGTSPRARRTVRMDDVQWADVIIVMEEKHKKRIRSEFGNWAPKDRFAVLDIPDDYRFMDPELIDILRDAVAAVLEVHGFDLGKSPP